MGVNVDYRVAGDYYDKLELYSDAAGNVRPLTRDDYVLDHTLTGTLRDGTPFSVPVYGVRSGLSNTGGYYATNTDRQTDYFGVSLTASKRLSNKWMLRGHFTWYDWKWKIGDEYRHFDDPTNILNADDNIYFGTDDDGAIYADQSGGSGSFNQFLNSTWSFNVSGLYQLPWGLNVSGNMNGREGYRFRSPPVASGAPAPARSTCRSPRGRHLPDGRHLRFDARIDKDFQLGDLALTLSADIFNVFNDGAIIQYEYRTGPVGTATTYTPSGTLGNVNQVIGPRIVRFGVRLAWK